MRREHRQHDRDSGENLLKASSSKQYLNVHHRRRGVLVVLFWLTTDKSAGIIGSFAYVFIELFQPRQAAGQKGASPKIIIASTAPLSRAEWLRSD